MNDIIGHGGGKGAGEQHTHYEATDSLHSTSFARVLDLISEGEILGLAHGMQSVYLNQTPVENSDGSLNFKDVAIDFRTGTQIQDYIPGFPDVENEVAVGVELRSGTPWTHAISNLALSAIRITLSVPALSKGDTTNGDILGYSVAYKIELSTDGGAFAEVLSNSFSGKTTTPYNRSARIDLPAAITGWSIRVTRLTANADTASIADTTNIISYTEVIDAKLRYPMSAIAGVQVDAKQFQSVPTRAYDVYGRIIQVPANYDPITRIYTGVWDGTFKPAWTSNPAWIFRDLVLHERYGLGNRIASSQLDKWALYAIAQYCDQLVSDGKGGTEPRFTCNLYLQSRKQAYAVLQDLASVFRGISYWGGGTIIASSDRPMDPVYVYTSANVVGGKFSRVGSSKKTRATVALVSWNDPADFYRAKVEYVEDEEGIARYGIQQISLTAFGCTSQGQAQRAGRWALATSRLETGVISFDVGMDGSIAIPGQIVRVADPARMGRRNGGRIHTAAGRVVTLDKAPIINVGDSLTVILPSGVSETLTVASIAGDAVTVSADWSTVPLAESVWSVDSSELMAPTYKVLSVKEKSDGLTYTITATQHEPGKFAYIEDGVAVTPRPQTSLDVTKQAPPAAVTIAAYTVSLQDVQKLAMSVSCAAVPGAVAYEGSYKYEDGNWIPIPRQPSPTLDVVDVLPGTYVAKIAAVNSIGITSTETLSTATAIDKNANPKNAAVLLTASTPAFHLSTGGTPTPTSIVFTGSLIDLAGSLTFSCIGGTLTSVTATQATLLYSNMTGTGATVTASIVSNGVTFSRSLLVAVIQDGAAGATGATGAAGTNGTNGTNGSNGSNGADGARGAGQYFATGSSWSDTTANTATPGANIAGDVVTISNGATFIGVKAWSGSAWVAVAPTYDGGAIFPGTVTANKISSNGLDIRDLAGNVLLGVGVPLATGYEAPGTKNSDIVVGGRNLYPDSGFERGTHPCTSRNAINNLFINSTGDGTLTPYDGTKALFFDTTGGDAYVLLGGPQAVVVPGRSYMLSFYYKTASSGSITGSSTYIHRSDGGYDVINLPVLNTSGSSAPFIRLVQAWTCPSGVTSIELRAGIVCSGYSWMWVDCIQLEEGNKATQWTPAPEDVAADTAAAQSTADAATTALADKLSKNAADILTAPITISTSGAIKVGTAAWTGGAPSGTGIVISDKGIAGVNAGTATFAIDATTGDASFGGALTAANMVGTSHIVDHSVSGFDYFTTVLSGAAGGNTFVVSATCDVMITCDMDVNVSGNFGYSIAKWNGAGWLNTYVNIHVEKYPLLAMPAGTYRVTYDDSGYPVTTMTIWKFAK